MSNTKYLRELLETVDVLNPERACERIGEALQELRQVEADRAKDAKLIQRLIHEGNAMAALIEVNEFFIENDVRRSHWHSHRASWMAANAAAEAAGFKPSDL